MNEFELDQEETEILEAFEAGEFTSDLTPERRAYVAQVAEVSAKKISASISAFPAATYRPFSDGRWKKASLIRR